MAASKQDMPPKDGYPKFAFARNLPRRGPSGFMLLVGGSAIMGAGFFVVIATNRKRRELVKEKLHARLALLPLLQAEHDRRMMKAKADFEEDERKVMALIKDYTPEMVYHSDRWVPPTKALVKDE